ncbi:bifunctional riboflavin kinase/FAD synthetase [Flavobacterium sp.]|uniref:bifunctional riboflavin kinase/FAD synthetase n=1 Tax=Flavobacterium sp. TaxID=239 RepID=UPI0026313CFC|nr:bifunctional riboflavin kinase/FAD synthetase [Flavobacterium sp.]MDD3003670.1 bifunctional riboflavin kinase/FAD synthetase [Flavobacterium sp.]
MNIYHSIHQFTTSKKTIITLGTFDGVHLGHKKIIERLLQSSSANEESLVLTFFPHPRMVLQEESDIKLLNTIEERSQLLEKAGLQNLIIHPFDQAFSRLTAEEFVKNILVEIFNIKKIIIGHDHRFGRNRTANIDDLIVFGREYGFEVEQISAQEIDEVSISSTKIRNALHDGKILLANEYLGYHYFFSGTVVHGKKLGRTIGFPTANLEIEENYKLIPAYGVYAVDCVVENQTLKGMLNIGIKPTFEGETASVEVHLFDFNADLYGKKIKVALRKHIREEQKFSSVEDLKAQLKKDELFARDFFESN